MKAYVIGMSGNHRNPSLVKELQSISIEVVVDDGFIPKESVSFEDVDLDIFYLVRGRNPTLGEIACAKAHVQAWKFLVDSGESMLLVLEDDAHLVDPKGLHKAVSEVENLKTDWIASLERREGDFLLSHFLPARKRLRRSQVQPTGLGAYLISQSAARRFLDYISACKGKIECVADFWPGINELGKWYISVPPVFFAGGNWTSLIGYSENEPRKISKSKAFREIKSRYRHRKILINGARRLLILKQIKYLLSVHFFTAWFTIRVERFRKL